MRFMLRVEAEDVSAGYAVLTVMGPEVKPDVADAAAAAMDFGFGTDLIVPRDQIDEVGVRLAGAGVPAGGDAGARRRCVSPGTGLGSGPTPIIGPSRTRWAGSGRPCT